MSYPRQETSRNAAQPLTLNKTDYAANGGTYRILGDGPDLSCLDKYPNCNWHPNWVDPPGLTPRVYEEYAKFNGISGERSEVTPASITDGLSYTFLAGEKYLNPEYYYATGDGADNNSMLQGNDWDTNRWCNKDSFLLQRDTPKVDTMSSRFGSAHAVGVHFVMCDGSVQFLFEQMDFQLLISLCTRDGEETIPTNF